MSAVYLLLIGIVLGFSFIVWLFFSKPLKGAEPPADFPQKVESLLSDFKGDKNLSMGSYEKLFRYFLEGYMYYANGSGALVTYPGLPSSLGKHIDRIESVTRIIPMLAAWLYSGRTQHFTLHNGVSIDLVSILKNVILAGTNPDSHEYWGDIKRAFDQRIVEAADVALTLWLTRNTIWKSLVPSQRERIVNWLVQANTQKIPDNNWHLFIVIINSVLFSLGHDEADIESINTHYKAMKSLYRGKGWFADGTKGGEKFDYYNAWGIHYALYWLDQINPKLDPEFIQNSVNELSHEYKYFFSHKGFPIYGRSICYRMAVPVPLIIASIYGLGSVSPGQARRAMDMVWRYFIKHDAVKHGTVTQGYFGVDPRILDYYSGPGSCLWSLRSLIVALSLPANDPYWQTKPDLLPIETDDFSFILDVPGWEITGYKKDGKIVLKRLSQNSQYKDVPLKTYGWAGKLKRVVKCKLKVPQYQRARYYRKSYTNNPPFCGC